MMDAEILGYYEHGLERERLSGEERRIEFLRMWDLLCRHLPSSPARVMDVGGGAGVYALPLAAAGYEVHLVDPVPLHVEQAANASREAAAPLASVAVGDARALQANGDSMDAALLLGPLYHLTSRADRVTALREAHRVVRPGGVVVAMALSRFYPLLENIAHGTPVTPGEAGRTEEFVASGQYRNPDGDPTRFTTAYFHRPEDLEGEVTEAGLVPQALIGVSGGVKLLPDFAERMADHDQRERVLSVLRLLETEPSVLGASQNFIAIARVPAVGQSVRPR